jgi:hypothetical protein
MYAVHNASHENNSAVISAGGKINCKHSGIVWRSKDYGYYHNFVGMKQRGTRHLGVAWFRIKPGF